MGNNWWRFIIFIKTFQVHKNLVDYIFSYLNYWKKDLQHSIQLGSSHVQNVWQIVQQTENIIHKTW